MAVRKRRMPEVVCRLMPVSEDTLHPDTQAGHPERILSVLHEH